MSQDQTERENAIVSWLTAYIAKLVERPISEIQSNVPLSRYGVDSASAVDMSGELEEWLGTDVDPTLAYNYPTIGEIAAHLAQLPDTNEGTAQ